MAQRFRSGPSHHDLGYSPSDDDRGRYAAGLQRDDQRRAPAPGYGYEGAGPEQGRGGARYGDFGPSDARGRSLSAENAAGRSYGASGASSSQAYWRAAPRRQQPVRGGPHRGHGPKGYSRTDERLHEAICERLMDDPDIDAREITVEVKDGVVTLEGRVESRLSKHIIEDLVDACSGVKDIRNLIAVRAAATSAPA